MSTEVPSLKHHSSFVLHPTGDEGGDALGAAANLVVDWFLQKEQGWNGSPVVSDFNRYGANPLFWDYHTPQDYLGGLYNDDRWPALSCTSTEDEFGDIATWVVEYDEPDTSHDERRWHTTVSLERVGIDDCRVTTTITCRLVGDPEDAEPLPNVMAAPALVRSIIDLPWFVAKAGTTQLRTVPHKLSSQTFDDFAASLVDPLRQVPLVLFCTGYNGKIPEHAKQLARRALGNANVYVLDWSNSELRDKELALFERGTPAGEYACPRSSARVYLPGVDLTNHNGSLPHTSYNREALDAVRPSEFADTMARELTTWRQEHAAELELRALSLVEAAEAEQAETEEPAIEDVERPAQVEEASRDAFEAEKPVASDASSVAE